MKYVILICGASLSFTGCGMSHGSGHENHASPAADIGDGAVVSDQPAPSVECAVHECEGSLRLRSEMIHDGRVNLPEAAEVANLGDIRDRVRLPRQPFPRCPPILRPLRRARVLPARVRSPARTSVRARPLNVWVLT